MNSVKTNYLPLSWSVSRGMSTYGYNICRLDDNATGKRFRCNGGGYDMVGTVIGQWLQSEYQERLLTLRDKAHSRYSKAEGYTTKQDNNAFQARSSIYGMCFHADDNRVSLDGACGASCMIGIAAAIGVRVTANYNRRKQRNDGYFVTDFGSAEALQAADKE